MNHECLYSFFRAWQNIPAPLQSVMHWFCREWMPPILVGVAIITAMLISGKKSARTLLVVFGLFLFTASAEAQFKENIDSLQAHRIPTEFRVFGSVVVVEMDSTYCNQENAWGLWNVQRRLIRLNNSQDVACELLE